MTVYCGIDWAERHHDIALIDERGQLVAKARIGDDVDGYTTLVEMLAAAGDSVDQSIPVAIETPRGLLVAALRASGRRVYAINPMAVARYRERYSVSRKKSDHADAVVLTPQRCPDLPRPTPRRRPVRHAAHQDPLPTASHVTATMPTMPTDQHGSIRPGDIYEDCAFHPVLCTHVEGDHLSGISLIDASGPRGCSLSHCGVIKLSITDVLAARSDWPTYVVRRKAEFEAEHPA